MDIEFDSCAPEKENKTVVIVFEPAIRGETLSLTQQVQQVFGFFPDDAAAEHWCKTFEKRLPHKKWMFLITSLDNPNEIPTDPALN